MDFGNIPFLARATPSGGGGGSAPVIHDSSRAGPAPFTATLTFTPPAGMAADDHLVLVGYWDEAYVSSDVGTFTDRTPASWSGAPSPRRLLISDSFGSVPESIELTFGAAGLHEFSVFSVPNILTTAVLDSDIGTTAFAAGARDHAYTTGAVNSLVVGFIDFIGGGVTGAGTPDGVHEWDVLSGSGGQHAFGAVRAAAGSYAASLAPTGASSGSQYGWAEIGAA